MFAEMLRKLRISKNLSQEELAKIIGVSKSTIGMYEQGNRIPKADATLKKLAEYFNVTIDYLMGLVPDNTLMPSIYKYDNISPIKTKKFRMIGEIACGKPIYCNENYETYIEASADIQADFCLTAKGDSMINVRIFDGDIVFIKEQAVVENGEIAAVIINDEATLKRVYVKSDKIILRPENPLYDDLVYEKEHMNEITILGKAVAFQSLVR